MTEATQNQPIAATPGFAPNPAEQTQMSGQNSSPVGAGYVPAPTANPAPAAVPPQTTEPTHSYDSALAGGTAEETPLSSKDGFFPAVVQDRLQSYTKKGKGVFQRGREQVKGAKQKLIQAKNKAQEEAPKAPAASLGTLVSNLSDQIHKLIVCEVELAKVKGQEMAKRAGIGIAMLAIAGILALYMLGFLFSAIASAFALLVPTWAAKLIVAAILLLLILIFALVGISSLKKSKNSIPAPQKGVKQSVEAVKKGL